MGRLAAYSPAALACFGRSGLFSQSSSHPHAAHPVPAYTARANREWQAMTRDAGIKSTNHWWAVGWSIPPLLLAIPLIAQAPWTLFDYIFAAVLFGAAGLLVEWGVKYFQGSTAYRIGAGAAVLSAFLLIWVNGAVGFLDDEDNPANLMFGGVIAVAAIGALLGRFQPAGMARAMAAAAIAQLLAGVTGLGAGWASPGYDGLYEVVMGTAFFGGLWLVSAALFRKAQRERGVG
jgi:hypothetical protein